MATARFKAISERMDKVIHDCLSGIDKSNPPKLPEISSKLLEEMNYMIDGYNATCPPGWKCRLLKSLEPMMIAEIMLAARYIVNISYAGGLQDSEHSLLAVYLTYGPNKGIYCTMESAIRELVRECDKGISSFGINEVLFILKDKAPLMPECTEQDLVPVNNGIFDYRKKQLMPFSPDYIFLKKSPVDYVPNAKNPVIHNPDDGTDWDVVEAIKSFANGDAEIENSLWEVIGAVIRTNVRWNKSAWLYSSTGRNGKGTLCELMRGLCSRPVSLKLSELSENFLLETLIGASAIITDENDVGTYIDKAANLKAIITHDKIVINRKFKQAVDYRFQGFMVQCLNEMPKVKDKSDSFYRRQLFIPFTKSFTEKEERTYIKDDYIRRKEVLEYVLYKVLNMDYYKLSEPAASKKALGEYKEINDPVRQYWAELRGEFTWNLLPFEFLYALYIAWFRENNPSGGVEGKTNFIRRLRDIVSNDPEWEATGEKPMPVGQKMSKPEMLIVRYNVEKWKKDGSTGSLNPSRIASPDLKSNYRGIYRTATATTTSVNSDDSND